MEKRYKVVMLPTGDNYSKKGDLVITITINGKIPIPKGTLSIFHKSPPKENKVQAWYQNQYLYILDTQAETKEGDFDIFQGLIVKAIKKNGKIGYLHNDSTFILFTGKIIASTNPDLKLLGIPQSFLQQIVNDQKVPEWVELETELKEDALSREMDEGMFMRTDTQDIIIKVIDNYVVVKEPKIIGIEGGELHNNMDGTFSVTPLKLVYDKPATVVSTDEIDKRISESSLAKVWENDKEYPISI